jgi:hypothetical protein
MTIDLSPGTKPSEVYAVLVDESVGVSTKQTTDLIGQSGSGTATYRAEFIVANNPDICVFNIDVASTGGSIEITIWTADNLLADLADDSDWENVTAAVTTPSSLIGSAINTMVPIPYSFNSRKLRIKCVITGGAGHSVSIGGLVSIFDATA